MLGLHLFLEKQQKRINVDPGWVEIMLQYCFPRLDINVMKGINHLLKSPLVFILNRYYFLKKLRTKEKIKVIVIESMSLSVNVWNKAEELFCQLASE